MSGPTPAMRLPRQPGEVIDRGEPVEFTWNGRPVRGYAGDTIISALAAAGERVFSRSMKYHRPRGLLTAGFYYKTFMRPRFAWSAYEGVLRRFVNAGTVSPGTAHIRAEKRHAHPD